MITRWQYFLSLLYLITIVQCFHDGNFTEENINQNRSSKSLILPDSTFLNEGRGFPSGYFGEPIKRTPIRRYHPAPIKKGSGTKSEAAPSPSSYSKIPDTRYTPQFYENFPPYAPDQVTQPTPQVTMMMDDNKGQPSDGYQPYDWGAYSQDTNPDDDNDDQFSKNPPYEYSDYNPDDNKKDENPIDPHEYLSWDHHHPKEEDDQDDSEKDSQGFMYGGKNKYPVYLDHPPWNMDSDDSDDKKQKNPKGMNGGGKNKLPPFLDHPPWKNSEEDDKKQDDDSKNQKYPEFIGHPPWEMDDDKKQDDDSKKPKNGNKPKYPDELDHPPWDSTEKPKPNSYPPWYTMDIKTPEKGKPSYFIDEMKDQGKENHGGGYWEFHGPSTDKPDDHHMEEERNKRPYSYYYLGRKLWYIPLYFSAYFIIYLLALILRSIARHKIAYPLYNNIDWASGRSLLQGNYITQLTDTVAEAISNTAKKYT